MACVYFIRQINSPFVKIGYADDVNTRLSCLQVGNPNELEVMLSIETDKPDLLEQELHRRFCQKLYRAEWFCFSNQELQSVIEELQHVTFPSSFQGCQTHPIRSVFGQQQYEAPPREEISPDKGGHSLYTSDQFVRSTSQREPDLRRQTCVWEGSKQD